MSYELLFLVILALQQTPYNCEHAIPVLKLVAFTMYIIG